jgi:hypothetical protein
MDANNVAMNGLLAKLYKTFTAPDTINGTDSYQEHAYFSFCSPGIPVTEASFDFLSLSNLGQLNAESSFAQVMNFIPNPTGFWSTAGDYVWKVYRDAISQAIVAPLQISPQEQQQLDAANSVLFQQVRRVDPLSGAIIKTKCPPRPMQTI